LQKPEYRVDAEELRRAMRQWATGVTIVTGAFGGVRHGMTVSSFTSISLEPPMVLVSLERDTRTHALVQATGRFGVTILNQQQQEISDRFAGRDREQEDRLQGMATYTLVSEVPLLAHGLAGFDCEVTASYSAGTHTLFIGIVRGVRIQAGEEPLLYFDRAYRQLKT
jgi:flavin reductase (DIM6/NTAB) family NADH-FMN oxidoreductase RutF